MATSSQYYRSANNHSHYHNYPPAGSHEHLYCLTASWPQDSNLAPYSGPSPAPFPHYSQGGAAPVSHQTCTSQNWSSRYAHQTWDPSLDSHSYASRTVIPYDGAEGSASVPHQPHENQRQEYHPHQAGGRYELPLSPPVNAYRSNERCSEVRSPSEFPANQIGPPFTTHALNPHTLTRPSHVQTHNATLHLGSLQRPLYPLATIAWNAEPEAPRHQQHPVHASSSLESGPAITSRTSAARTGWHIEDADVPAIVPSAFERTQGPNQQWDQPPTQSEHGTYAQQHAQFGVTFDAFAQSGDTRKSSSKKAARVPSSFVERQEKLKVSKRRGPLQEKQREKTHTMRRTKRICVRCRFYKSGCDEGDPCEKCLKIAGHARSFREPCYREHLEDTSLVRRCNGREHQEEAEFLGYDWLVNSQLFEMEILWNLPGYGPIPSAQPIRVTYRPYSPKRGSLDVAASVWSNNEGEIKTIEQPAYAIYDTASLLPAFERYFSSLQPAIEKWVCARVQHDEIASITYAEVQRMRTSPKGSAALDYAMRIQCLSVVSQGYGSVWSNNIPGIREYDYGRLGSSDYEAYDRKTYDRPLPGAITHQMDVAAVKYLKKLEKEFVKKLAALIFQPKIKPWYELFLALYVIFWNLEYIHHGANDYIKSKNGTMIENQVNGVVNTQIKKWEFAFPILLYHWRCTLRGYSPFKLARENPQELRDKGHIDDLGYAYVSKIAEVFDRVDTDRFQPPLTGFASTHYSMSSEWIVKLFKEAGA